MSHNPYFNRWFSAIKGLDMLPDGLIGHNPYFNRWFSAIKGVLNMEKKLKMSQSLF